MERIEVLKLKLVKEGYQPSESEYFIKSALGTAKVSEMSVEQLDIAIEALEKQILIAQKCKQLFKG
ncbi:hypothetical protein N752_00190 [Desulforamulus aquiferis]|nr:hypothetical protein [Desulforamulus aquiferis]RYD07033.1 hypothetical protein N752_00190 [Desulforamulus aquiferis]